MNELKPEDVMRALECCDGSLAGCEKCPNYKNRFCCTIEENALALLREKDAEIKELTDDNKWSSKRIIETDKLVSLLKAEVERLQGALKAEEQHNELTMECAKKALANARAEAITEFAERLKVFIVQNICVVDDSTDAIYKEINQIEKEMKGAKE